MVWQFFEEKDLREFHKYFLLNPDEEELKSDDQTWQSSFTSQTNYMLTGYLPLSITNCKDLNPSGLSPFKMDLRLCIKELALTATTECTAEMANQFVWNY